MSGLINFGRKVIYSDVEEITLDNLADVLTKAVQIHEENRRDIEYLYRYYKGEQPILHRTKDIRPEICNRIVENRANEIVSFKVGYLMGEPIQYVSRKDEKGEDVAAAINLLNEYMFAEDKAAKDKQLAEWFHICGTSYRMILQDPAGEEDEAPFEIYTLDPRNAFVIYSSALGNKPLAGVKYIKRDNGGNGEIIYSIYTRSAYYEISVDGTPGVPGSMFGYKLIKSERHILGAVPIIEYPANDARLGAFEIVLGLLDALNDTASNRLDGVEQFIQALLVLKGVDIENDAFNKLKELGGIVVPQDGDVSYLIQELNQSQTQTLEDSIYDDILTICGMPNRNGGLSTSDTGSAVVLRDGWYSAETRARDSEMTFKMSEKAFLKVALNVMNTYRNTELKLSNIDIRFTRRNYENIQEKSQVLITMLNNEKIHPKLAFEHSGLFSDPNLAYSISAEYYEQRVKEQLAELENFAQAETVKSQAYASDEGAA